MAIRKLEIPGKLITTAGIVDAGPTGEFAVDSSADAGLTQTAANITGSKDTNQFTFSCWFLTSEEIEANNLFFVDADEVNAELGITIGGTGEFQVEGTAEGSGIRTVFAQSTDANIQSDVWYHFIVSVDNTLSNSDAIRMYLNDRKLTLALESANGGAMGIGQSDSNWFVANERTSVSGIQTDLCFAAVWFDIDRWVDLDVEANRRKFINSNGRPIALGVTGERPFGESPIIYFDNPIATWNVNRGSGGNFRFVDGNTLDQNAWTTCASSPDTGTLG